VTVVVVPKIGGLGNEREVIQFLYVREGGSRFNVCLVFYCFSVFVLCFSVCFTVPYFVLSCFIFVLQNK